MKELKITLIKSSDPVSPPVICPDTMRNLKDVIPDIKLIMSKRDIEVFYDEETKDFKGEIIPAIIINGKTLEELVPLPNPAKYCGVPCAGCSSNSDSKCQRIYKEIPESVLRLAVKKAAEEL